MLRLLPQTALSVGAVTVMAADQAPKRRLDNQESHDNPKKLIVTLRGVPFSRSAPQVPAGSNIAPRDKGEGDDSADTAAQPQQARPLQERSLNVPSNRLDALSRLKQVNSTNSKPKPHNLLQQTAASFGARGLKIPSITGPASMPSLPPLQLATSTAALPPAIPSSGAVELAPGAGADLATSPDLSIGHDHDQDQDKDQDQDQGLFLGPHQDAVMPEMDQFTHSRTGTHANASLNSSVGAPEAAAPRPTQLLQLAGNLHAPESLQFFLQSIGLDMHNTNAEYTCQQLNMCAKKLFAVFQLAQEQRVEVVDAVLSALMHTTPKLRALRIQGGPAMRGDDRKQLVQVWQFEWEGEFFFTIEDVAVLEGHWQLTKEKIREVRNVVERASFYKESQVLRLCEPFKELKQRMQAENGGTCPAGLCGNVNPQHGRIFLNVEQVVNILIVKQAANGVPLAEQTVRERLQWLCSREPTVAVPACQWDCMEVYPRSGAGQ